MYRFELFYVDEWGTLLKDSPSWVAPFVSDFLDKYGRILDEKCVEYLRKTTGMQI